MLEEGVSTQPDLDQSKGAQGVYRRAIEYVLETVHRQAKSREWPWTDVLARSGIGVQGRVSVYEPARWEEVLPTRRFEVKGFRQTDGQGGLGAPVVIHLTLPASGSRHRWRGARRRTDPSERHFPDDLTGRPRPCFGPAGRGRAARRPRAARPGARARHALAVGPGRPRASRWRTT